MRPVSVTDTAHVRSVHTSVHTSVCCLTRRRGCCHPGESFRFGPKRSPCGVVQHVRGSRSIAPDRSGTAGQRVLDVTGNLKAAQKLLGHASISTTADVYTDWDLDQLAETMREVVEEDERIVPLGD